MKHNILITTALVILFTAGCDVQSGITKKSVEKFESSPTPEITKATPEPPLDPADIVTVDTSMPGPPIAVNKSAGKKPVDCTKYNNVTVNADQQEVVIKGACQKLMINGDGNRITGTAFNEIVINGSDNKIEHSKYVNGKRPIIDDNAGGNTVSKVAAAEDKKGGRD
jgi:hypothetical protein